MHRSRTWPRAAFFAWKSKEAIEAAHSNRRVQEMWEEYAEACEHVPIAELDEAKGLFSEFAPVRSGAQP